MPCQSDGGFHYEQLPNGWTVGRFDALTRIPSVIHAVTTRRGPVLSTDLTADAALIDELAAALDLEAIAACKQVHGASVLVADGGGLAGSGDGLVTNTSLLGVLGRSADCPLVLTADPASGAVGMAHSSWRSTVGRIPSLLVAEMAGRFGADPARLVACICPSAGPCCYEVRDDVLSAAAEGLGPSSREHFDTRNGKTYFNMWSAIAADLIRAGLSRSNVHISGVCTICNNDMFPSYRSEGAGAGRFAAVIAGCRGLGSIRVTAY